MNLFKKSNAEKNILVVGPKGCGKRSFILQYKDGVAASDEPLPALSTITYNKKLGNTDHFVALNFIMDRASDELIVSASANQTKFDLILILTDLSSEHAIDNLELYAQFARTHYHGVNTLTIGTKSDKQLPTNLIESLITTSAKTGEGFKQFEEQFQEVINPREASRSCVIL